MEDLYRLVERAAGETGAVGVSAGAILSDYQRVRVESVCSRLGLTSLAFLWRRDQVTLIRDLSRNLKLVRSPRIGPKETIPSGCVAWRAGTTTLLLFRFLAPIDCLKIPAQDDVRILLFGRVLHSYYV